MARLGRSDPFPPIIKRGMVDVVVAPTPNVSAWGCQPVRAASAVVAAACVLAFVPVVQAAPVPNQPAWATQTPALVQPVRVVQSQTVYPVTTGTGVQWIPRLPDLVRRVDTAGEKNIALPVAPGLRWWIPRVPDLVRPVPSLENLYAKPLTVPAPAGVNWIFPRQPDPIFLPLPVISQIVAPITGAIVADGATADDTGGQLIPRPAIHNASIAGPMAVGSGLGWWPRLPDLNRQIVASPSVVAAPLTVQAPAGINWWFSRTPDSIQLVPPITSTLAAPPVAGLPGWCSDSIEAARPTFLIVSSLALPVAGGPGGWVATDSVDAARLPQAQPSVIAEPINQSSTLPWLLTGSPLIQPVVPIRSLVALNPTTPVAQAVTIPWLMPSGSLVFLPVSRYEATYAKPILPFTAGRSDLPWLLTGAPLIRPSYLYQSSLALNPTTPAAQLVTMPWLVPPGQVVYLPVARYEPVYAKPMLPFTAGGSNLPWLLTGGPLVRPLYLYQSSLALNPTTPAAGVVTMPWVPQVPAGQVRPLLILSQLAVPLQPTSALWWPQQPTLVRLIQAQPSQLAYPVTTGTLIRWAPIPSLVLPPVTSLSSLAQPIRVQVDTGWFRLPSDANQPLILVRSRLVSPIQPYPAGRSDLPWLPQAPPGKAVPVGAPSSMVLPPYAEILAAIGLPSWIIQVPGWPDVIVVGAWADTIVVEKSPTGSVQAGPTIIVVPKFPPDVDV